MNDEQLTVFRRRNIGFVFQNYNLVPILNVYQNIVLPVELDGNKVDQEYTNRIIHMLHLEEKLITFQITSPAASSSGSPLPERWQESQQLSWQMNQPETWIPKLPSKSCSF